MLVYSGGSYMNTLLLNTLLIDWSSFFYFFSSFRFLYLGISSTKVWIIPVSSSKYWNLLSCTSSSDSSSSSLFLSSTDDSESLYSFSSTNFLLLRIKNLSVLENKALKATLNMIYHFKNLSISNSRSILSSPIFFIFYSLLLLMQPHKILGNSKGERSFRYCNLSSFEVNCGITFSFLTCRFLRNNALRRN